MMKYMQNDLPDPTNQASSIPPGLSADDSGVPTPQPFGAQPIATPVVPSSTLGGVSKEHELPVKSEENQIEEVVEDIELEPDLERLGIEKTSEAVTLPPEVRQMGVTATGPAQPVQTSTTTVKLPLSDNLVLVGLHASILSSLRWLAEWCIRQLKKAHIHLKKLGGNVVRENN